jgi:hypothetical protein
MFTFFLIRVGLQHPFANQLLDPDLDEVSVVSVVSLLLAKFILG